MKLQSLANIQARRRPGDCQIPDTCVPIVGLKVQPIRGLTNPGGGHYQPALDGLRALSVIAVLLFHQGFGWASAGFLGVSTFFTLSGFLITGMILREFDSPGGLNFRDFYARRLRRLLPASLACILLVLSLARTGWWGDQSGLGSEARWVVFNLQNWNLLRQGVSYGDLFAEPSPFEHFWSLAIEEQFYILWPPILVALLVGTRRWDRERIVRLLALLFVASVVASYTVNYFWGASPTYFASPARAPELLAGALLAFFLHGRVLPPWSRAFAWLGLLLAGAAVFLTSGGWAYEGGLPLFAIISAGIILGLQSFGPIQVLLSCPPMTFVGSRSYGIYLYHWPLFLVLDEIRTGMSGLTLFALRLVATFVIAEVSLRIIERPIRSSSAGPLRTIFLSGAAVSAVALLSGLGYLTSRDTLYVTAPDQISAEALERAALKPTASTVKNVLESTSVTPADQDRSPVEPPSTSLQDSRLTADGGGPLRVLLLGDSTAVALGSGAVSTSVDQPDSLQVQLDANGACGVVRGGIYEDVTLTAAMKMTCDSLIWRDVPTDVSDLDPDVVVILVSLADTWRRSWDDGTTWLDPTEPEFAARVARDYDDYFDLLVDSGAKRIVWLIPPSARVGPEARLEESFSNGGQEVIEASINRQLVRHPGVVFKLDLADWFEQSGLSDDGSSRPDGIHVTESAASEIVKDWLVPQLRIVVSGE
jgi:peptidoglycan/LPS O-acetylase OafA/YrhL